MTGLCLPNPIPFSVGANGIALRRGALYVANTEKALIVRVPLRKDGTAGTPTVVAQVPDVDPPHPLGPPALDGIALDIRGNIYALVINQSRLVRIDRTTGAVATLATDADDLDFPASLAFGRRKPELKSLFVTNFAIGPPGGVGPSLVKLRVGIRGQRLP